MPLFRNVRIEQAVLAFVNEHELAAKKRIVEERRDLLLTDEADRVFTALLEQYKDDPDVLKQIEQHHDLLRRCRSEGSDAAFVPLMQSLEIPDISPELIQRLQSVSSEEELEALIEKHPELIPFLQRMAQQADEEPSENTPTEQAVLDFLNADTWQDSKRIVEDRRDLLLTNEADQFLGQLLKQYKDDPDALKQIEQHRDLLRRCCSEGIDAAFAPLIQQGGSTDIPDEIRPLIAEMQTLTRLSDMPRRVEVIREILKHLDRSQQPTLWAAMKGELAEGCASK